jgi:hypothetical protein
MVDSALNGSHGESELWFWGGVIVFVGSEESTERKVQFFGAVGAAGVGISVQNEGLCHVAERGFRGLSLDLRSSAVVPAPDPSSEAEEKLLLDGLGAVEQVRVPPGIAAKLEPVVPVSRLAAVVHCCSCNRLPSSVDVTSEIRAGVRGTRRQDCCCGRGKRSVKWV